MSGSGDHFSDKLMRELKTAFALISRTLQTDGIDTSLSVHSVVYPTELPADNFDLPCDWDTTVTTSNGLPAEKPYASDNLPLLPPEADLVHHNCQWSAVLVSEPVFSAANVALRRVDFRNISHPGASDIPIPKVALRDTIFSIPIPTSSTVAYNAPMQKLQKLKDVHILDLSNFRRRTRPVPLEILKLPILRAPIPPHRFSSALKSKFRKALIDKAYGENAEVPSSNIQIQVVYDRINLSLFSGIEQDERGYLKCYPKPEILQNPSSASKSSSTTYLVVGTRLDTRESIKALVPMEY